MSTFVAFLRGINVGGNNRIAMNDLSKYFVEAGATAVRTYIQSGNVVFDAGASLTPKIIKRVQAMMVSRLGLDIPVVVQSATHLSLAVADNPYLSQPEESLHLAFLSSSPKPSNIARLDPDRSPGDSFQLRGDVIYLHFPNGLARTKLSNAYFDSTLGVVSTMRNWKTVRAMLALCASTS